MSIFKKIKSLNKTEYLLFGIKIYSKTVNSNIYRLKIIGIPVVTIKKDKYSRQVYLFGMRIYKEGVVNLEKKAVKVLEKEIIRLEGYKILAERENMKMGAVK